MCYRNPFLFLVYSVILFTIGCSNTNGAVTPSSDDDLSAIFTHTASTTYQPGNIIYFDASESEVSPQLWIAEYIWDWGDESENETFKNSIVTHIYTDQGSYEAILTVRDNIGLENSSIQIIEIYPPGSEPVAFFSFEAPDGPHPGLEIVFDASDTSDPDGDDLTFTWDWGDESELETSEHSIMTHIYTDPGVYEVVLTVRDMVGLENSSSQTIEIYRPGSEPTAVFYYEAPGGWQPGMELIFDASESSDPDGDDLTYSWDWGDGEMTGSSPEPVTTHVFIEAGTFEVRVTVTDSAGWETISDPVEISIGYPDNVTTIGSFDTDDFHLIYQTDPQIEVYKNYAFVSYYGLLYIFDLNDPENLALIRIVGTVGQCNGLAIYQDHLYLVSSGATLQVLDISEPEQPQIVQTIFGYGYCITIHDEIAYVWGKITHPPVYPENPQFLTIDIQEPANPEILGSLDGGRGTSVTVLNGYAYIVDKDFIHSMKIIDVNDPTNPFTVNTIYLSSTPYRIKASMGRLFLLEADSWTKDALLSVYDVTNPAKPSKFSTISGLKGIDMQVIGNYVYLADYSLHLRVYDFTDPADPQYISTAPVPLGPSAVGVYEGLAFTASFSAIPSTHAYSTIQLW